MKKNIYILLIFIPVLFCNGSCESKENQRLIIQNNSEKEIIIVWSWMRELPRKSSCLTSGAQFEYEALIRDVMIKPHSSRNFERNRLSELTIDHPNDTLYIGVFYRTDIDTMSCEEFEQKFPLKKEWKVTSLDMQVVDWILVFKEE